MLQRGFITALPTSFYGTTTPILRETWLSPRWVDRHPAGPQPARAIDDVVDGLFGRVHNVQKIDVLRRDRAGPRECAADPVRQTAPVVRTD